MKSNLVVLMFEGQFGAEGMLEDFQRMQEEGLIEVEDAVVASRRPRTRQTPMDLVDQPVSGTVLDQAWVTEDIEIKQTHSEKGKFALRGSGIGLVAGLLLGGPIGGLAAGAVMGTIAGALKDYGIDGGFIHDVTDGLRPDTSALFLLVKEAKGEEVLERLKPFKAKVFSTTLGEEQEKKLREALEEEDPQ